MRSSTRRRLPRRTCSCCSALNVSDDGGQALRSGRLDAVTEARHSQPALALTEPLRSLRPSIHRLPRPDYGVIAPSMPGFGFSDKPAKVGWGFVRIADARIKLVVR